MGSATKNSYHLNSIIIIRINMLDKKKHTLCLCVVTFVVAIIKEGFMAE